MCLTDEGEVIRLVIAGDVIEMRYGEAGRNLKATYDTASEGGS